MAWFNTWKTIAWVALSAAIASGPALSQESNNISSQIDETRVSVQSQTDAVVMNGYNKNTNTLTIPASSWVIVGWPINTSTVDVLNKSLFKDIFDLNKDWNISVSEIEQKFEINLSDFNAIYRWDLSFFDKNSEIISKRNNLKDLIERRKTMTEESDIRNIDKSITSLNSEITLLLNKLYIEYFDLLIKKVNYTLKDDSQKLLFLSYLPQELNLENFKNFLVSNLKQKISENIETYQEISYVSDDVTSSLLKNGQKLSSDMFTSDDLAFYSSNFYDLKDVYNSKILSVWLNEDNLFEYLSDINNDWKLTNTDKSEVYGLQLSSILKHSLSQLSLTQNNEKFYSNLSYVFSLWGMKVDIKNNQDLLNLLSTSPEAKFHFQDGIKISLIKWWDIAYVLMYGEEWIEKFNQLKQKLYNDQMLWVLVSKIEAWISDLWNQLAKIKANGLITDKEYADQLAMIEKYKLEPWFHEKIFEYAVWLLSSVSAMYLSETSNMSWAKMQYSKTIFNPQMQEITKKFVDSISLELWVANTQSWNMLMVWLAYKVDSVMSEDSKITYSLWARAWLWESNNILPFLSLAYTKITNLDDVKRAWFQQFDLSKTSFSVWVDYSMLNVNGVNIWIFAWWSEDRLWALEVKFSQYKKSLDNVLIYNDALPLDWYIALLDRKLSNQEFENISFLRAWLKNIKTTLEALDFDKKDIQERKKLIEILKHKLSMDFITYYSNQEESKWWELSHFWARASLLSKASWLAFLPSIWATKLENVYDVNSSRYILWKMSSELLDWEEVDFSIFQWRFLSNLEKFINVKWLDISYEAWILKLTSKDGSDIFEFLEKNWMNIYIEPSEKIMSEVWFKNNSINIWNIWSLWVFVDSSKDGRKVALVLWTWWIAKKLSLTKDTKVILENNFPSSITKLDVKAKNLVLQNSQRLTKKYFWI